MSDSAQVPAFQPQVPPPLSRVILVGKEAEDEGTAMEVEEEEVEPVAVAPLQQDQPWCSRVTPRT
jgi:hypothetical protein